jgi:hypothetical protein
MFPVIGPVGIDVPGLKRSTCELVAPVELSTVVWVEQIENGSR